MRLPTCSVALPALILSFASAAAAESLHRAGVVTDETGSYIVAESLPGDGGGGAPRTPPEVRWAYDTGFAIPQNVALSGASDSAWVGEDLNFEQLDRFAISGNGTPTGSYPVLGADFTTVAASKAVDRAAFLHKINNELRLTVHSSTDPSNPHWTYTFSEEFTNADYAGVKVSRDGSTVAALVVDPTGTGTSQLYVFNADGTIRSTWPLAGFAGPIDLDDTGSLCLVTAGSSGRVINTSTGTQIFSAPGTGGGARHKISGDGRVLVLGGFSFQVYLHNGTTYALIINFSAPTSWFGWGAAVSRDGNTVAAMSHDYGAGYRNTSTRIWDVPSRALLGTFNTVANPNAGTLQDAISGAVLSDDGSVLAVSSWGAADNNHPEVMVFNRQVQLIGSVDTRGSVFSLDMTGGGIFVLSGNKGAHANTFGNGGDVTLYQVRCLVGDMDCNCSVNLSDLTAFLSSFGLCQGDPGFSATADLDGNGCVNLSDLTLFLSNFGNTCGA